MKGGQWVNINLSTLQLLRLLAGFSAGFAGLAAAGT